MRDEDVKIDRSVHVLYSKKCKREILNRIALYYAPEAVEGVFEKVQLQYAEFLENYRTDLGGRQNLHNGVAGTYDCIALFSYYVVCGEKTSLSEIEEMNNNLFLPSFRRLRFADANKPFIRRLLHLALTISAKKSSKWGGDYKMDVDPFEKDKPVSYRFTSCPIAEFARDNHLLKVLPAICNGDYPAMEEIHAKLVRPSTCGNGCECAYYIYGDRDQRLSGYPEYVDEQGYRTNKV